MSTTTVLVYVIAFSGLFLLNGVNAMIQYDKKNYKTAMFSSCIVGWVCAWFFLDFVIPNLMG